jgi:membrane protein implicated in regulation of membrane protease activity
VKRFLRENSLSLFFAAIFVVALLAQSFAGQQAYNAAQATHGASEVSWTTYVASAHYWGNVMENWESEFLQFALFIGATIWLVQKGSNESKQPGSEGLESDQQQNVGRYADASSPLWARVGGLRQSVYENSLLLVMGTIFFATWFAQSLNNWRLFNEERREHDETTLSWGRYLIDPDFWDRTLQNWQSEFLAVGTMAVFTIYLRQRGSPESKPVGAPHDETASSG